MFELEAMTDEKKTKEVGFKKEPIAIPDIDYQTAMLKIESAMRESPGFVDGDFFPLKHTFAHGMYIREIFVPAGSFVLTYVHKQSHPCFVLQGDTTVIEPEGNRKVSAPHHFITPAGMQRLCFCHTDTIWATVHLNLTNERDMEKIEKDLYACHYSELYIDADKNIDTKEITDDKALAL